MPTHRQPRSTPSDWEVSETVGRASKDVAPSWLDRALGVRTAYAQEADPDLAETTEVRFLSQSESAIQALLDDEGLRGSPAKMTAPEQPGAYEVRYLSGRKYVTLGSAAFTVAAVTASLEAPGSVGAGETFDVEWTGPDNSRDWVALAAVGAGWRRSPRASPRSTVEIILRRMMMAMAPVRERSRAGDHAAAGLYE